jgi:hypothetical protein
MTDLFQHDQLLRLLQSADWTLAAAQAAKNPDALASFCYGTKDMLVKLSPRPIDLDLRGINWPLLFDQIHSQNTVYGARDTMHMLGIKSRGTLYKLVNTGAIDAHKINRSYFFTREAIETFLEQNKVKPRRK